MRVNVYAEEMTDRVEIIGKEIDGHTFTGLRLYLHLPVTLPTGEQAQGPFMHRPGDDDSSAVTFWGKRDLRVVLRKMIAALDKHYAAAPVSPPADHKDKQSGMAVREALADAYAALQDAIHATAIYGDEPPQLYRDALAKVDAALSQEPKP